MDYRQSNRTVQNLVSMPFIYFMVFPIVIMDLSLELFHRICFALYGLEYIDRGKYIKIDRHKLSKLNPIQKLNCVYCGYANGLLAYAVAVGGRTEKYWCGIKHRKDTEEFLQPDHHEDFLEYEDFA